MSITDLHKFYRVIREVTGQENVLSLQKVFILMADHDVTAALVLTQTIYWSGLGRDPEWFYKSYADWEETLGLTQHQVRRAVNKLTSMGFVETKLKKAAGAPTLHYRVNEEAIMIGLFKATGQLDEEPPFCPNGQIDLTDRSNELDQTGKTLTETTTETTPETTSVAAAPLAPLPAGLQAEKAAILARLKAEAHSEGEGSPEPEVPPPAPPLEPVQGPDFAPPPGHEDSLFYVLAQVCAIDLSLPGKRKQVGKAMADLKKAAVPYTAEEVREFRRRDWRPQAPTLWQVVNEISSVRQPRKVMVHRQGQRAEPKGYQGLRDYAYSQGWVDEQGNVTEQGRIEGFDGK